MRRKLFLRNCETLAPARFREPVCSVMLFWPVDTSSSATTKGRLIRGEERDGFQTAYIKCLLLLPSPSTLPVLWVCLTSAGYSTNKAPCYGLRSHCIYLTVTAATRSAQCKHTGSIKAAPSYLNFNLSSHAFGGDVQQIVLRRSHTNSLVCVAASRGKTDQISQWLTGIPCQQLGLC